MNPPLPLFLDSYVTALMDIVSDIFLDNFLAIFRNEIKTIWHFRLQKWVGRGGHVFHFEGPWLQICNINILMDSSTETVAFQVYEILKIDHEFLQFFWLGSKI